MIASAYSAQAPQRWTYSHCEASSIHYVFPDSTGSIESDVRETKCGSGVIMLPACVRPMLIEMNSSSYIAWVESEALQQKSGAGRSE